MKESPELPESLEDLIVSFARMDSPLDPFLLRSEGAVRATTDPPQEVSDDELHAAAVRFRNRFISLALAPAPTESAMAKPWTTFRVVSNFVTPGDLRIPRRSERSCRSVPCPRNRERLPTAARSVVLGEDVFSVDVAFIAAGNPAIAAV